MISGVPVGEGSGVEVDVGTSVGKKNVGVGGGGLGVEVGVGRSSTLTHADNSRVAIASPRTILCPFKISLIDV
jgi:hypothetical protein